MSNPGWLLRLFVFMSVLAVPFVPLKVYPLFFLMSPIFVILLVARNGHIRLRLNSRLLSMFFSTWLYVLYVILCYLFIGGVDEFLLKTVVNFLLLIGLVVFVWLGVGVEKMKVVIALALSLSIVIIFIQVLYSVGSGGLWMHPFRIENSEDAYMIQRVVPVVYGDENKNIWSTKSLIYYIGLIILCGLRDFRVKLTAPLMVFVLIYTSSRTAQLAALVAVVAWCLGWLRVNYVRWWFVLMALLITGGGLYVYVGGAPVPEIDLSGGHGGDGLFARFILWSHFAESVGSFSVLDWMFGHGVMSVAKFINSNFEENNLHNVVLNQLYDYGLVGLLLYLNTLRLFWERLDGAVRVPVMASVFVIFMSQYFGNDPELILLMCCILISYGMRRQMGSVRKVRTAEV